MVVEVVVQGKRCFMTRDYNRCGESNRLCRNGFGDLGVVQAGGEASSGRSSSRCPVRSAAMPAMTTHAMPSSCEPFGN